MVLNFPFGLSLYSLGMFSQFHLCSGCLKSEFLGTMPLSFFILFFLSTALLHHFFIDKVEGRSQEETVCEHIVSSYNILKTVYSNPKNLLWQIDNILIGNLYYIVLVWFPYYFSKLGFEKQSSTISIMLPLAACFGTIIIGA